MVALIYTAIAQASIIPNMITMVIIPTMVTMVIIIGGNSGVSMQTWQGTILLTNCFNKISDCSIRVSQFLQ